MIELHQALSILKNAVNECSTHKLSLSKCFGHVLAEDIIADTDMPPFNKSAMDGYACRLEDLLYPLEMVETISAGNVPGFEIDEGKCAKIMTGAKIPNGANCVIMIEHTEINAAGKICFTKKSSKSNICLQGEDYKKGDLLIPKGTLLNPASAAVCASVGKPNVLVYTPPKVTIIATGDELVPPQETPQTGKIRNSNTYNLLGQLAQTPAVAEFGGIVADTKNELRNAIERGLNTSDILILTGGVSMGEKDFVPELLSTERLQLKFDKIAIQPGKPVAFAYGNGKYCFGLSGNPVSSFLQFELLVRPFIYFYMGYDYELPTEKVLMPETKSRKKIERLQFFPVQKSKNGITILPFNGSAHINGLIKANAFGMFPVGKSSLNEGSLIQILKLH